MKITEKGWMLDAAHMRAPDGYKFLIRVPNYWGTGDTVAVAMWMCEKAGARPPHKQMDVFIVDPKAKLDDEVSGEFISRPENGKQAILIFEFRK